jgi:hypothetical protein
MNAVTRPAPTILEFTPIIKNSLRGFARVKLASGMVLVDVALHVSNEGRAWASPASKVMLDRSGNVLRDEAGKPKYVPIVDFCDRKTRDRFSEAVVAAVKDRYPDALT